MSTTMTIWATDRPLIESGLLAGAILIFLLISSFGGGKSGKGDPRAPGPKNPSDQTDTPNNPNGGGGVGNNGGGGNGPGDNNNGTTGNGDDGGGGGDDDGDGTDGKGKKQYYSVDLGVDDKGNSHSVLFKTPDEFDPNIHGGQILINTPMSAAGSGFGGSSGPNSPSSPTPTPTGSGGPLQPTGPVGPTGSGGAPWTGNPVPGPATIGGGTGGAQVNAPGAGAPWSPSGQFALPPNPGVNPPSDVAEAVRVLQGKKGDPEKAADAAQRAAEELARELGGPPSTPPPGAATQAVYRAGPMPGPLGSVVPFKDFIRSLPLDLKSSLPINYEVGGESDTLPASPVKEMITASPPAASPVETTVILEDQEVVDSPPPIQEPTDTIVRIVDGGAEPPAYDEGAGLAAREKADGDGSEPPAKPQKVKKGVGFAPVSPAGAEAKEEGSGIRAKPTKRPTPIPDGEIARSAPESPNAVTVRLRPPGDTPNASAEVEVEVKHTQSEPAKAKASVEAAKGKGGVVKVIGPDGEPVLGADGRELEAPEGSEIKVIVGDRGEAKSEAFAAEPAKAKAKRLVRVVDRSGKNIAIVPAGSELKVMRENATKAEKAQSASSDRKNCEPETVEVKVPSPESDSPAATEVRLVAETAKETVKQKQEAKAKAIAAEAELVANAEEKKNQAQAEAEQEQAEEKAEQQVKMIELALTRMEQEQKAEEKQREAEANKQEEEDRDTAAQEKREAEAQRKRDADARRMEKLRSKMEDLRGYVDDDKLETVQERYEALQRRMDKLVEPTASKRQKKAKERRRVQIQGQESESAESEADVSDRPPRERSRRSRGRERGDAGSVSEEERSESEIDTPVRSRRRSPTPLPRTRKSYESEEISSTEVDSESGSGAPRVRPSRTRRRRRSPAVGDALVVSERYQERQREGDLGHAESRSRGYADRSDEEDYRRDRSSVPRSRSRVPRERVYDHQRQERRRDSPSSSVAQGTLAVEGRWRDKEHRSHHPRAEWERDGGDSYYRDTSRRSGQKAIAADPYVPGRDVDDDIYAALGHARRRRRNSVEAALDNARRQKEEKARRGEEGRDYVTVGSLRNDRDKTDLHQEHLNDEYLTDRHGKSGPASVRSTKANSRSRRDDAAEDGNTVSDAKDKSEFGKSAQGAKSTYASETSKVSRKDESGDVTTSPASPGYDTLLSPDQFSQSGIKPATTESSLSSKSKKNRRDAHAALDRPGKMLELDDKPASASSPVTHSSRAKENMKHGKVLDWDDGINALELEPRDSASQVDSPRRPRREQLALEAPPKAISDTSRPTRQQKALMPPDADEDEVADFHRPDRTGHTIGTRPASPEYVPVKAKKEGRYDTRRKSTDLYDEPTTWTTHHVGGSQRRPDLYERSLRRTESDDPGHGSRSSSASSYGRETPAHRAARDDHIEDDRYARAGLTDRTGKRRDRDRGGRRGRDHDDVLRSPVERMIDHERQPGHDEKLEALEAYNLDAADAAVRKDEERRRKGQIPPEPSLRPGTEDVTVYRAEVPAAEAPLSPQLERLADAIDRLLDRDQRSIEGRRLDDVPKGRAARSPSSGSLERRERSSNRVRGDNDRSDEQVRRVETGAHAHDVNSESDISDTAIETPVGSPRRGTTANARIRELEEASRQRRPARSWSSTEEVEEDAGRRVRPGRRADITADHVGGGRADSRLYERTRRNPGLGSDDRGRTQTLRRPDRATTIYPPTREQRNESDPTRSASASRGTAASGAYIRHRREPGAKGAWRWFWTYISNARWLSAFFIAQIAITAAVSRQLAVLVMISRSGTSGGGASALAKRAAGESDLPPDLAATHSWLTRTFANTVSPDLAFLLLCTWIGLAVFLLGYLYHLILSATDSPAADDGKEKEAGMHKVKRLGIAAWKGTKSALYAGTKVITMDRHPSLRHLRERWGKWTCIRLSLFIAQLLVTIIVVRQTLGFASIVVGATPPSGFDIGFSKTTMQEAARGKTGDDIFLLVLVVLAAAVTSVTWSWYALLHPRKKDMRAGRERHGSIIFRILTGKIFGQTFANMSDNTYRCVQVGTVLVLVIAFASCVGWFSTIMAYAADVGFVKDAQYTDSIGVITAFVLFGLFVLPIGWALITVEDLLRWAWSSRKSVKGKGRSTEQRGRGRERDRRVY